MKISGMLETGAMIIIGIIALKAFGGIKGITSMLSDVGGLLGTGGGGIAGGGAAGSSIQDTIDVVEDLTDMPPADIGLVADIGATEAQGDLLSAIAYGATGILGGVITSGVIDPMIKGQVSEIIGEYVEDLPAYTPSPTISTPIAPPVWIQEPDMIADIARPPGSFGGR